MYVLNEFLSIEFNTNVFLKLKQIFIKNINLIILLLITIAGTTQNVTIDYEAWDPSSPPCNVFANATNVPATGVSSGVVEHQTRVGQPTYNSTAEAIELSTNLVSPSSSLGTRVRINYNFKAGHTYGISVIAAAQNAATGQIPAALLRIDINNNAGGGSTGCEGPGTVNSNTGGNPAAIQVPTASYSEIPFSLFTQATNQPTLELTSIPAANSTTNAVRIKKLIIIEIPPPPTFTITYSPMPIQCGATTPVSFSVNNVNASPGTLTYNWDLGGQNNGWIYNGNSAPSTIQTTDNTISLTPVCGAAQTSINVAVTLNGIVYNTNTATISYTQPDYSINGSGSFCSGNPQYNITNLPCNATVIWDPIPTGIVSISTNDNVATLTKIADGQFNLRATITSCGIETTRDLNINVGLPSAPTLIEIYGNGATNPLNLCAGSYRAEVSGALPSPQYQWRLPDEWTSSVSGGNNPFIVGPEGFDIPIEVNPIVSSPPFVWVRTINGCGFSDLVILEVGTDCYGYRLTSPSYTLYPNPASTIVKVDGTKNSNSIQEIQVMDKMGKVKRVLKYSKSLKKIDFDVTGLTPDIYYFKIFDGKTWQSVKLKVE